METVTNQKVNWWPAGTEVTVVRVGLEFADCRVDGLHVYIAVSALEGVEPGVDAAEVDRVARDFAALAARVEAALRGPAEEACG